MPAFAFSPAAGDATWTGKAPWKSPRRKVLTGTEWANATKSWADVAEPSAGLTESWTDVASGSPAAGIASLMEPDEWGIGASAGPTGTAPPPHFLTFAICARMRRSKRARTQRRHCAQRRTAVCNCTALYPLPASAEREQAHWCTKWDYSFRLVVPTWYYWAPIVL